MPTDLNTGEPHLRLMPAGQRQDQLAPFLSYDSHHDVPRRNIIRAQMSEGLAYAGYFNLYRLLTMSGTLQGDWISRAELDSMIESVQALVARPEAQWRTQTTCSCGQAALFRCNDCTVPGLCKDCVLLSHGPARQNFHKAVYTAGHYDADDPIDVPRCAACGSLAEWTCSDCATQTRCAGCLTGAHEDLPLHIIWHWREDMNCWTLTNLRELGMRIYLGHDGEPCPAQYTDTVEALTMRGLMTMAVAFCGCRDGRSRVAQMRSHGWVHMGSNFVLAVPSHTVLHHLTEYEDVPSESEPDGGSRSQEFDLSEEMLWSTAGRPRDYEVLQDHHQCTICRSVKAHPVSYECGHSHCYVCIRLWLERSWQCPDCRTTMHRRPFRHWGEEAALTAAYAGWGQTSAVEYSWEGLTFPKVEQ
ncbi:hypothetical protein R3P38DRAFT_3219610 [Favolaschia claudopus]|uniref:RING-type domain-containing protein n=1 Tax=Favolaschia claudopus TaxID=2862362 RepID=A0AAW0A1Z7_9AGAR